MFPDPDTRHSDAQSESDNEASYSRSRRQSGRKRKKRRRHSDNSPDTGDNVNKCLPPCALCMRFSVCHCR